MLPTHLCNTIDFFLKREFRSEIVTGSKIIYPDIFSVESIKPMLLVQKHNYDKECAKWKNHGEMCLKIKQGGKR